MMNWIWFGFFAVAFVVAAVTGNMEAMTQASMDKAKAAVMLSIGLVGVMAFWLGMMKVAQDAGLMKAVARAIRPLMTRLFPDVPADHPAMSSMIMNMAANLLGLGNAATPFGLKAMKHLDELNPKKGTATNAMALFLAINTSNVTLLPLGAIAIRHAAGSKEPAAIMVTTLFATICSTIVAISAAKALSKLPRYAKDDPGPPPPPDTVPESAAEPEPDPDSSSEQEVTR